MTEVNQLTEVRFKLERAFPGAEIQISNTGSMHKGHGSCGLHLKTSIIYSGFNGVGLLDQHRLVHEVLKDDLGGKIHAISIFTKERD